MSIPSGSAPSGLGVMVVGAEGLGALRESSAGEFVAAVDWRGGVSGAGWVSWPVGDCLLLACEMALQPAAFALDGLASLSQSVGVVTLVLVAVGLINAAVKGVFVGSFVHRQVALAAFEIPFGLLKGMFIRCDWMLLLCLEKASNDAGPVGFLPSWSQSCSLEPGLYGLHCETLVDPGLAGVALAIDVCQ